MVIFDSLSLFSILARTARYMPAVYDELNIEQQCRRLQSFAALRVEELLNTNGGLEKSALYTDKDIFFSRKWENEGRNPSAVKFDYPGCFIWESNATFSEFYKNGGTKQNTTYMLSVLDQMPSGISSTGDISPCARLTYEQKSQILKDILIGLLKTIAQFKYIEASLAGNPVLSGWYHPDEIAKLTVDGIIDTHRVFGVLDGYILTKNIEVDSVQDVFVDKLMGVVCEMQFSFQTCVQPFVLDVSAIPDSVKDSFAPCCK